MSISITTETEAAASLGLNPGDLLPPDDAASTRLNLTLETVELGRQEEAARREAARDFPWRHDKQVAYDQATLDLQMYRMLHEEAESPAKRETLGQYPLLRMPTSPATGQPTRSSILLQAATPNSRSLPWEDFAAAGAGSPFLSAYVLAAETWFSPWFKMDPRPSTRLSVEQDPLDRW